MNDISPLDALNSRQHKFVLNLFSGMSQVEAYRQAGYEAVEDAVSAASHLADDFNVIQSLAFLRQVAVAGTCAPVSEIKERLSQIVRHGIEMPVSAGHIIAASDQLNKLEGSYAPTKSLTGNITRIQVEFVPKRKDNATE